MGKLEVLARTQTLVDRVDKLRDLFLEESDDAAGQCTTF